MKENRQQWRSESPDSFPGLRLHSGSEAAPRRSAFGGRTDRSFGLRLRLWAAGLLAGVLLVGGCSKQTSEDPAAVGEKTTVRFDIDGFGTWAAQSYAAQSFSGGSSATSATRAASAPALNTTVRVIAYKSGSGNPAQANYADDRAYYWDGAKLVPCTVDDNGNRTDGTAKPMELLRNAAYDFYAVSPALPLAENKTTLKTAVANGMDYATSVTKIAALADDGAITLETLERQCARVSLKVLVGSEWVAPTSMSINSMTVSGLPDARRDVKPGAALTAATGGTESLTLQSEDFFGSGTTYTTDPWLMLPMEDATLTFNFDLQMNGVRTTFDDELRFTPEKGKNYTITATITAENALNLTVAGWDENNDNNPGMGGGNGYPYVVDGTNIIVCADAYGMADTGKYPLHTPWKMFRLYGTDYPAETPQHEESGEASNIYTGEGGFVSNSTGLNAVAARFEVAGTTKFVNAWSDARQFCLDYDTPAGSKGQWRMPTYLELRLIYEKKGELTMDATTDNYRWSATKVQGEDSYWSPNFSKGTVSNVTAGSTVRCVRDL